MRMVVCSTRDQQHNLKRIHPDDFVVVEGDQTAGVQVTEIIDETYVMHYGDRAQWIAQWWTMVQCRIEPDG